MFFFFACGGRGKKGEDDMERKSIEIESEREGERLDQTRSGVWLM